jgi:hypothetical protein
MDGGTIKRAMRHLRQASAVTVKQVCKYQHYVKSFTANPRHFWVNVALADFPEESHDDPATARPELVREVLVLRGVGQAIVACARRACDHGRSHGRGIVHIEVTFCVITLASDAIP